jgi:hypothetical protein
MPSSAMAALGRPANAVVAQANATKVFAEIRATDSVPSCVPFGFDDCLYQQ